MKPIIEFKDYTFKYKIQNKPTLYDINLCIYEGEKVLILGPSGSGKSTLASCINGLNPFSEAGVIQGNCKVSGVENQTSNIHQISKLVGTVLQDSDAQFVGLSVGEDIAFAMENDNTPRAEMIPKVKKSSELVGMQDFLHHLPYHLSGGQKQKVALAGVMHENVQVLIFDEPLAALDPQMGMTAVDLIDRICRENNKTVVIIEHRLEDVLYRRVDRIILMDEGRIIADTTPDALLRGDAMSRHGIREPLYLTAMKYAGCNLDEEEQLTCVEELALSQANREKLTHFFHQETKPVSVAKTEELIRVENASYAYDESKGKALSDISCVIHKAECVSLIGKNGAGKTTFARMVCGIARPQEGSVLLSGQDYLSLSIKEIGERIGYVMQNPNQMLVKDVIKNEVALALELRNAPKKEIDEKVARALKMCNLYPMREWPVDAVSYGQKKRITIASILALEPDIILLDEPTSGQDYRNYTEIIDFITTLNREFGKTIIFITHDMHLAMEYTNRAIVFADAEIIADDSVFHVLSDDDVIKRASLKQTSLYLLAQKLDIDPRAFIRHFVEYERMVKLREE